jgi:hypothetical protein
MLSDVFQDAAVGPGSIVDCASLRSKAGDIDDDGALGDPRVRIWFVPHAAALREEDVDPEVAERLRALGYTW